MLLIFPLIPCLRKYSSQHNQSDILYIIVAHVRKVECDNIQDATVFPAFWLVVFSEVRYKNICLLPYLSTLNTTVSFSPWKIRKNKKMSIILLRNIKLESHQRHNHSMYPFILFHCPTWSHASDYLRMAVCSYVIEITLLCENRRVI